MADLQARITLDNSRFIQGMREAQASVDNTSRSVGGMSAPASRATSSMAGMVKGAAGLAIGLKAMHSAIQTASEGYTLANNLESEQVRLEVLLGSAAKAEALMNAVVAKAGETPLQVGELQEATRMLVAFGSSSKDVVGELTRLGDISQGVDMPIRDLAELYGKARVQGTLFAEDINQLTGRGIPIIGEFARIMGVTEGEVKKLASEGKIGFAQLEQAITNMTSEGGQFAGMMERMADTGDGALSTLRDNFDQLIKLPMGKWVKSWVDPMVNALNYSAASIKEIQKAASGGFRADADKEMRATRADFINIQTRDDKDKFIDSAAAGIGKAQTDLQFANTKEERMALLTKIALYKELMDRAVELNDEELKGNEERVAAEKRAADEKEAAIERAKAKEKELEEARETYNKKSRQWADEKDDETFEAEVSSSSTDELFAKRAQLRRDIKVGVNDAAKGSIKGDLAAVNAGIAAADLARARLKIIDAEIEKHLDKFEQQKKDADREAEKIQADQEREEKKARANRLSELKSERLNVPNIDNLARLGLSLGGDNVQGINERQLDEMRMMRKELAQIKSNTAQRPTTLTGVWG